MSVSAEAKDTSSRAEAVGGAAYVRGGGPLRVLQANWWMEAAGVEALLMSVYRALDRSVIQFDFLEGMARPCFYDDEIRELGGRVYKVPWLRDDLDLFFSGHPEYDIVHVHMSDLCVMDVLGAARRHGVSMRVLHAHNANVPLSLPRRMRHRLNALRAPWLATDLFACSAEAASYFGFGKGRGRDWRFVPNGIDVGSFAFDAAARTACRRELGLAEGAPCVGMVGRYDPQKNMLFALDAFGRLRDEFPTARLLVVGGRDKDWYEEAVVARVRELGLGDSVTLLRDRHDVNRFYSAMDAFMLPSLYEGLGIVFVEAQDNGLPCVVSEAVPEEAFICPNTAVVPLADGAPAWAGALGAALRRGRVADGPDRVAAAGFDVDAVARELADFYLDHARRRQGPGAGRENRCPASDGPSPAHAPCGVVESAPVRCKSPVPAAGGPPPCVACAGRPEEGLP